MKAGYYMSVRIFGPENKAKPEFQAKGTLEKVFALTEEYCADKLGESSRFSDKKVVLDIIPGKTLFDAKVRLELVPKTKEA